MCFLLRNIVSIIVLFSEAKIMSSLQEDSTEHPTTITIRNFIIDTARLIMDLDILSAEYKVLA